MKRIASGVWRYVTRGERHPDPVIRPQVAKAANDLLRWWSWILVLFAIGLALSIGRVVMWLADTPSDWVSQMLFWGVGLGLASGAVLFWHLRVVPRARRAVKVNSDEAPTYSGDHGS
jgi:hypothetical protein